MSNDIIDVYNIIASKYYDLRENLILYPEFNRFNEYLLNTRDSVILDAGCGNGRDVLLFAKNGYNVYGIDYSDSQLNFAFNREYPFPVYLLKQNILNLDFPNNMFDGIWCNAVLPHFSVPNIMLILSLFQKCLKPNGVLMATFKRGNGECYVIEKEFDDIERFTSFQSEDMVRKMITNCGLGMLELYSYNERERFGNNTRDLDFIVSFSRKV